MMAGHPAHRDAELVSVGSLAGRPAPDTGACVPRIGRSPDGPAAERPLRPESPVSSTARSRAIPGEQHSALSSPMRGLVSRTVTRHLISEGAAAAYPAALFRGLYRRGALARALALDFALRD
jgi:hypothetical protein